MEAFKSRFKTIAWFLTALILFQSCVVYHSTPTSLDTAYRKQTKTKVINRNGEAFKYRLITYENGEYYGVERMVPDTVKTSLSLEEISRVYTKNQTATTLVNIGVFAIPVVTIIVLFAIEMDSVGDWEN